MRASPRLVRKNTVDSSSVLKTTSLEAILEKMKDDELTQRLRMKGFFHPNLKLVRQNPTYYFSKNDLSTPLPKKMSVTKTDVKLSAIDHLIKQLKILGIGSNVQKKIGQSCRQASDCKGKLVCSPTRGICVTNQMYERDHHVHELGQPCTRAADCTGNLVCSPIRKRCVSSRTYESDYAKQQQKNSRCVAKDASCKGETEIMTMDTFLLSTTL